jgi:hypothetical protein
MDEFSTTSDTLDQAEEEILTHTVSDEALEDVVKGKYTYGTYCYNTATMPHGCCG